MRLRRGDDGSVYLNRWGFEVDRIGGIFLHHIEAPDPGVELHDHPWAFWSLVLKGSYDEERSRRGVAPALAARAERMEAMPAIEYVPRGRRMSRPRWSWKKLGVDECHRIVQVNGPVWTLVVRGPRRQPWGFFLPSGWVDEHAYEALPQAQNRNLADEKGSR